MEIQITQELLDLMNVYINSELIKSMFDFGLGFREMTIILNILKQQIDNWQEQIDNI